MQAARETFAHPCCDDARITSDTGMVGVMRRAPDVDDDDDDDDDDDGANCIKMCCVCCDVVMEIKDKTPIRFVPRSCFRGLY